MVWGWGETVNPVQDKEDKLTEKYKASAGNGKTIEERIAELAANKQKLAERIASKSVKIAEEPITVKQEREQKNANVAKALVKEQKKLEFPMSYANQTHEEAKAPETSLAIPYNIPSEYDYQKAMQNLNPIFEARLEQGFILPTTKDFPKPKQLPQATQPLQQPKSSLYDRPLQLWLDDAYKNLPETKEKYEKMVEYVKSAYNQLPSARASFDPRPETKSTEKPILHDTHLLNGVNYEKLKDVLKDAYNSLPNLPKRRERNESATPNPLITLDKMRELIGTATEVGAGAVVTVRDYLLETIMNDLKTKADVDERTYNIMSELVSTAYGKLPSSTSFDKTRDLLIETVVKGLKTTTDLDDYKRNMMTEWTNNLQTKLTLLKANFESAIATKIQPKSLPSDKPPLAKIYDKELPTTNPTEVEKQGALKAIEWSPNTKIYNAPLPKHKIAEKTKSDYKVEVEKAVSIDRKLPKIVDTPTNQHTATVGEEPTSLPARVYEDITVDDDSRFFETESKNFPDMRVDIDLTATAKPDNATIYDAPLPKYRIAEKNRSDYNLAVDVKRDWPVPQPTDAPPVVTPPVVVPTVVTPVVAPTVTTPKDVPAYVSINKGVQKNGTGQSKNPDYPYAPQVVQSDASTTLMARMQSSAGIDPMKAVEVLLGTPYEYQTSFTNPNEEILRRKFNLKRKRNV